MVLDLSGSSNNNDGNGSSSRSDGAAASAKEEDKSILLVDRNRDSASVLETLLVKAGFLVTAYTDPVLAATHFSANPSYNLVLWNMRGGSEQDEIELVNRIKKVNPNAKVLVTTMLMEHQWPEIFWQSKANEIIENPPDLRQLVRIVVEMLLGDRKMKKG